MYVSSTLQEPLVGFSSRRHLWLISGAYRCTHRQMVVWSADRPRSVTSSSTSRYEREYRKYQRTAHTMITGSKCRHLNNAGRGLHTAPHYQNPDSRFATHPKGSPKPGCTLTGSRSDSASRSENLGLSVGRGGIAT